MEPRNITESEALDIAFALIGNKPSSQLLQPNFQSINSRIDITGNEQLVFQDQMGVQIHFTLTEHRPWTIDNDALTIVTKYQIYIGYYDLKPIGNDSPFVSTLGLFVETNTDSGLYSPVELLQNITEATTLLRKCKVWTINPQR